MEPAEVPAAELRPQPAESLSKLNIMCPKAGRDPALLIFYRLL
jgi:hypothetical protein